MKMCLLVLMLAGCAAVGIKPPPRAAKIPVILDTDAGNDIDDNFAIVALLRNSRLDVKLITTTDGQADHRGRIIAKLLTIAGRSDIPIGLGAGTRIGSGKEATWVEDFPLDRYAGTVQRDGVAALIDTINHSPGPITIIAIGPLQTLAAALEKDPSIGAKANFVGMQGSVFKGYGGSPTAAPEFNVKVDVAAAQKVLSVPWRTSAITPLDACGLVEVSLAGERYERLRRSDDPLVRALLESYAAWSQTNAGQLHSTTTLYDAVAIYLADPDNRPLIQTQPLKIAVTGSGLTVVSPNGREMMVATSWKDLEGYRDHLVESLLRK